MNNFKQEKPAAALTRPWVVGLAASFCCLLWGSAFPAVKIGYRLLDIGGEDSAAQIVYAGLRFFIAGVLIVLFHCLRERRFVAPKSSSWPMVAKLGLVQTAVQYFFFYIGMAHTSGVKASVITASNVFWAILISALVFRFEGLGWNTLLGCLCGFLGVVVINLSGGSLAGGSPWRGRGPSSWPPWQTAWPCPCSNPIPPMRTPLCCAAISLCWAACCCWPGAWPAEERCPALTRPPC